MPKEWTIQALERDLPRALETCRSGFERDNVMALHRMEIRQLADSLHAAGKLTPGGRAIALKHSWTPRRDAAPLES